MTKQPTTGWSTCPGLMLLNDLCMVEPLLGDTSTIRTSLNYWQLTWSQRNKNWYKLCPCDTDTSICRHSALALHCLKRSECLWQPCLLTNLYTHHRVTVSIVHMGVPSRKNVNLRVWWSPVNFLSQHLMYFIFGRWIKKVSNYLSMVSHAEG